MIITLTVQALLCHTNHRLLENATKNMICRRMESTEPSKFSGGSKDVFAAYQEDLYKWRKLSTPTSNPII